MPSTNHCPLLTEGNRGWDRGHQSKMSVTSVETRTHRRDKDCFGPTLFSLRTLSWPHTPALTREMMLKADDWQFGAGTRSPDMCLWSFLPLKREGILLLHFSSKETF